MVLLTLCHSFRFEWPEAQGQGEEVARPLTTVQQRGQNHQRSARARSRNRDQQGDRQDGAIGLWGRERVVSSGTGCVCNQHGAWVGQGNTCGPPAPHSHPQYADLRPGEEHSSLSKWLRLCSAFWATLYVVNAHKKWIPLFSEALFFSL